MAKAGFEVWYSSETDWNSINIFGLIFLGDISVKWMNRTGVLDSNLNSTETGSQEGLAFFLDTSINAST